MSRLEHPGQFASSGSAASPGVRIELATSAEALAVHSPAWQDLSARALEPNFINEVAAGLAAARHLAGPDNLWVLVWSSAAQGDVLIGLFALTRARYRWGPLLGCLLGWEHLYTIATTPLIDKARADLAVGAWLDWWCDRRDLPGHAVFPLLRRDGAFWPCLRRALTARGLASELFDARERAALRPAGGGEDYLRGSLGKKRLKEYRRLARRLEDEGPLKLCWSTSAGDVGAALERFCALEAAGWKGKRGTAIAARHQWTSYFRDTLVPLAEAGQCRIAELRVGERLVASTMLIGSGEVAWLWKIAYDEAHARSSPGVLLVLEVTKEVTDDGLAALVDSCAIPDHPMIDKIWRERIEIADLMISVRPGRFTLAFRLEAARRHARTFLKNTYLKLRKGAGR